jgi:hypothetical protein
MDEDDLSKHIAAGSLVSLKDFLNQHAAFFEANGYRVQKILTGMEFTRLRDGRTIKILIPIGVVASDQTRENFLADIESTFREDDAKKGR